MDKGDGVPLIPLCLPSLGERGGLEGHPLPLTLLSWLCEGRVCGWGDKVGNGDKGDGFPPYPPLSPLLWDRGDKRDIRFTSIIYHGYVKEGGQGG